MIDILLALIGGGIISGIVALYLNYRKEKVDTKINSINEDTSYANTAKGLLESLDLLRKILNQTEEKLKKAEHELSISHLEQQKKEELALYLHHKIALLESALPVALINTKLENITKDLQDVFDEFSDPVIISTPEDSGYIRWVNISFCKLLNRTREEILELGWRRLVHHDDLYDTLSVEAQAWDLPVRVVNRWQHKDGHYVTLRWYSTSYNKGVSLSTVKT